MSDDRNFKEIGEQRQKPGDGTLDARARRVEELLDCAADDARGGVTAPAEDAQMRAELALQREIDGALKSRFRMPADLAASAQAAPPVLKPGRSASMGFWRAAAVLIAGLSVGIAGISVFAPGGVSGTWQAITGTGRTIRLASLEDSYKLEVAHGFQPYWVCKNDAEFSDTFARRFGTPLHMKDMSAAADAGWGLDYKSTITHKTVALLARIENQPVMVFIDLAEHDRKQPALSSADLKLYRREVGPYVLYELSPFAKPRLTDQFYSP